MWKIGKPWPHCANWKIVCYCEGLASVQISASKKTTVLKIAKDFIESQKHD